MLGLLLLTYINDLDENVAVTQHGMEFDTRIRANQNSDLQSLYPWTIPEWNILPNTTRCAPTMSLFKSQLDNLDMDHLTKLAHIKI